MCARARAFVCVCEPSSKKSSSFYHSLFNAFQSHKLRKPKAAFNERSRGRGGEGGGGERDKVISNTATGIWLRYQTQSEVTHMNCGQVVFLHTYNANFISFQDSQMMVCLSLPIQSKRLGNVISGYALKVSCSTRLAKIACAVRVPTRFPFCFKLLTRKGPVCGLNITGPY